MSKNIAIFIDGTGNAENKKGTDNTNVLLMSKMALEQPGQCCVYIPGIGTETTDSWSPFTRMRVGMRNLADQAFGLGATRRVQQAYEFLAKNYQTNDFVFLFGFSRGAFIARTLAGFINRVGLLFASAALQHYVEYAFYIYWKDNGGEKFTRFLRRMENRSGGKAERIRTHFLGQWDTVEALFEPKLASDSEAQLREIAVRERMQPLPDWIDHASHALAVHDLRSKFAPLLWSDVSKPKQVLQQVWFAGAHADVGGGYETSPAPGRKFSDITLAWMRDQAKAAGLKLAQWDAPVSYGADFTPHLTHPIHELLGPMLVREALRQPSTQRAGRTVIHDSALKRLLAPPSTLYDTLDQSVRQKWIDADSALMQLHYKQWYPRRPAFPELSPFTLDAYRNRLEQAMSAKRRISKRKVMEALSLIAIFDQAFLKQALPQNLPRQVANWLELAVRALQREFDYLRTIGGNPYYGLVDSALQNFQLRLTLPPGRIRSKPNKI